MGAICEICKTVGIDQILVKDQVLKIDPKLECQKPDSVHVPGRWKIEESQDRISLIWEKMEQCSIYRFFFERGSVVVENNQIRLRPEVLESFKLPATVNVAEGALAVSSSR